MFDSYKIVVNTAAGRRRYMQYLVPQVLACNIVDRYDLWINTMNSQDIEFFRQIAQKYPKVNLIWQPDGVVDGNKSINVFYKQCMDENTIYFKLDDDIIWMEDDLIEKMVRFRIKNPDYFLVSPIVINNSLSTYLLQVHNKIKLYDYQSASSTHPLLWESGKFAYDLHSWFLRNYLETERCSELHIGGVKPMGLTRFSINAIMWFGTEMKKMHGDVPGDDEEYLSCIYPAKNGLANAWNGDSLCAHFAFFTQRERLDSEDILGQYGKILERRWKENEQISHIYADLKNIMLYVDEHKNSLPPAPYKKPVVNAPSRKVGLSIQIKLLLIKVLPSFLIDRIEKRNDDKRCYITD
jgi:hypothetical protein